MIRYAIAVAAASAAAMVAGQGAAQTASPVAEARKAGIVGERYDGYMGFAATPSRTVRSQVGAINIRRRALYTNLATRRRVTVQVAAIAAGCTLLSRVEVGGAYMMPDGQWRRRAAGEPPPRPEHCGS